MQRRPCRSPRSARPPLPTLWSPCREPELSVVEPAAPPSLRRRPACGAGPRAARTGFARRRTGTPAGCAPACGGGVRRGVRRAGSARHAARPDAARAHPARSGGRLVRRPEGSSRYAVRAGGPRRSAARCGRAPARCLLFRRRGGSARCAARPHRHAVPARRMAGTARNPARRPASYGDIARRIGAPAAVRAVGAAVGRNPVSVIVPCHRVIGADGALTGYAGGLDRKVALLRLEGAPV